MGHDFTDDALYGPGGVFYPRGYVFAMFLDAAAAQVAVTALAALAEIGSVQLVSSATIVERMSPRAADRGMPSVGREDQFMRRFVELARDGMDGVLIAVGHAVPEAIASLHAPCGIRLSPAEHAAFAGNAIALAGTSVWMSAAADAALIASTRQTLAAAGFRVRSVALDAIEAAGGSLRCCVAEIF